MCWWTPADISNAGKKGLGTMQEIEKNRENLSAYIQISKHVILNFITKTNAINIVRTVREDESTECEIMEP